MATQSNEREPRIKDPKFVETSNRPVRWGLRALMALGALGLVIALVWSAAAYFTSDSNAPGQIAGAPAPNSGTNKAEATPPRSKCLTGVRTVTLQPGESITPPQSDCAWGANFIPPHTIRNASISGNGPRLTAITANAGVPVTLEIGFCPANRRLPNSLDCF